MPTGRDVLLGLMLNATLSVALGYSSILPFGPAVDGPYAPVIEIYGWDAINLSILLPYLLRQDLLGPAALWIERADWALIAVLAIGAYMVIFVGDLAVATLVPESGTTPDEHFASEINDLRGFAPGILLYAGSLVIVGPIIEELIFRGLIYTHLRAWLGALPTIAITGVLFGLLHGGPPGYAAAIVVSGVVFGALREISGGIVAPTAAHMLNNLIATLDYL